MNRTPLVLAVATVLSACAGAAPGTPTTTSTTTSTSTSTSISTPTPTPTSISTPTPTPTPTPTATPTPTSTSDAAAPIAAADGGGPDAAATAEVASDAGPSACPDGMVLVDGDYCTELETKCLRSTYAKQNDKTICWEFQQPTTCTGEKVHKRYCVDKYEYPDKAGEKPTTMNDFVHAQRICAAQGKRMCTETEWTMACEGPAYKPYPYGYDRDPKKCNGDRPYIEPDVKKTVSHDKAVAKAEVERLYQAVPSGSQPECVSDYGVADMPGNADELASSETFGKKSSYDNVTTGGPWVEGVRNQCRPKIYTHNEGFAYYYLSFRCCAEPDGKPTDPRSPKQIKRGQKWNPRRPSNSD